MRTSTFALVIGIAYLGAGILGLIPATLMPPPADAPATTFTMLYGYFLGLFPMNLLHTMVHLAIGVWGIAAWAGSTSSVVYARALAVLYGALAVMGLMPNLNTVFGLIPIHGHDVWLHGATAAVAAYFGWRAPAMAREGERRILVNDRRQRMLPVARERRFGLADRREGFGGMAPA
jgi:hypothetical protein